MKRLLARLAVFLLLPMLALPWLAQSLIATQIRTELMAMGAEEVRLDSVDIDVLNGRVDVYGLEVIAGGESVFHSNTTSVDWHWSDLAGHGLRYGAVDGGFARIELREGQKKGEVRVALPGLQPPATDADNGSAQLPEFLLERLDLTQFRLMLQGVQRSQTITVEDLRISRLGTLVAEPQADVRAMLGLAGGSLAIQGRVALFEQRKLLDRPRARLRLHPAALDIGQLAGLVPVSLAAPASGAALAGLGLFGHLDGDLRVRLGDTVGVDGELHLAGPGALVAKVRPGEAESAEAGPGKAGRAQGDGQSIKVAKVDWKGALELLSDGAMRLDGELGAQSLDLGSGYNSAHINAERSQPKLGMKALHWQGTVSRNANSTALQVKGKTRLTGVGLRQAVAEGHLALQVQGMTMDTDAVFEPEWVLFEAKSLVQLDGVSLRQSKPDGGALVLVARRLDWDGRVSGAGAGGLAGERYSVANSGPAGSEKALASRSGSKDKGWRMDGTLSGPRLEIMANKRELSIKQLHWQGVVQLAPGPSSTLTTRLDSQSLRMAGLGLSDRQAGLILDSRDLAWKGTMVLAGNDARPTLQGKASLGESVATLAGSRFGLQGLALDGLNTAADGAVSGRELRVNDLWVKDSRQPRRSRAQIQGLRVQGLTMMPPSGTAAEQVSVDSVTLNGADVHLLRSASKQWVLPGVKPGPVRPGVSATTREDSARQTRLKPQSQAIPAWRIASLVVNDARVQLYDQAVSPATSTTLAQIKLSTGSLDSHRPDHDSPVRFAATLGEYGKIRFSGSARPLAKKVTVDLKGKIAGLGLVSYNAYVEKALGQKVEAGQLDADVQLKIVNNEIDSHSKLLVHKLEIEEVDKTGEAHVVAAGAGKSGHSGEHAGGEHAEQASLPIGLALTLLRDSNNEIRLELPLKGSLDDPKFDPSDAIAQAAGSAMTTGVALFIQPLGSLLLAGKMIAGAASAIRFEPAVFAPGSARLDGKQREYLRQLAAKLKARPQMRMKLCGRATEADRQPLQAPAKRDARKSGKHAEGGIDKSKAVVRLTAKLRRLASTRGQAVRDFLIKRAGVDHTQLIACSVAIEDNDKLPPRVELGL